MERSVFVTGADRGLGLGLCAGLLEGGWQVFAGQYMPGWPELQGLADRYPGALHLMRLDVSSAESVGAAARAVAAVTERVDVLINNAGVASPAGRRSIREPQDYADMHRLYDVNALGPLRVVEAFLPLTDRSAIKRLCFISSEAGSIAHSTRTTMFGYCMSKCALNMGVKNLFNHLRPEGYTFRVHYPGWLRSYMGGTKSLEGELEPEEAASKAIPILLGERNDEDRLVMVDNQGEEWPW
jgi:NAD(P)-dependent dehydrogenase (short-subunit alcohol dehydrogenase family)